MKVYRNAIDAGLIVAGDKLELSLRGLDNTELRVLTIEIEDSSEPAKLIDLIDAAIIEAAGAENVHD